HRALQPVDPPDRRRPRVDAVAGHGEDRARRGPEPEGAGVHPGRAGAGDEPDEDHPAAPGPERPRAGHRRRDARDREHDRPRGRALLPRPGRPAAAAVVGEHGRRRAAEPDRRVVGRDLPRARDRGTGPRVQPARRRAARRARSPAPDVTMANTAPLLEVTDPRTYFDSEAGTARAVDGVSFAIEEGEVLGIVGESGSGKSVTSLSLMRLVPEPPGRI